jgi:hypothetical protein
MACGGNSRCRHPILRRRAPRLGMALGIHPLSALCRPAFRVGNSTRGPVSAGPERTALRPAFLMVVAMFVARLASLRARITRRTPARNFNGSALPLPRHRRTKAGGFRPPATLSFLLRHFARARRNRLRRRTGIDRLGSATVPTATSNLAAPRGLHPRALNRRHPVFGRPMAVFGVFHVNVLYAAQGLKGVLLALNATLPGTYQRRRHSPNCF